MILLAPRSLTRQSPFVRTAERSSFSQAADDLNIPRAIITNLIKRMELRLGAPAHVKDVAPWFRRRRPAGDLVREGVDCVLRAGTLRDSPLIARKLASMEHVTVASPDYLARFGEPKNLEDLPQHFAVDYVSSATVKPIPPSFVVNGSEVEVKMGSTISVTGADLYTASAIAGGGLIQVPRYRIEAELANARLKVVLAEFPPPPMPVSVLYQHNRQLSPRVRIFTQWLEEIFRTVPYQTDPH